GITSWASCGHKLPKSWTRFLPCHRKSVQPSAARKCRVTRPRGTTTTHVAAWTTIQVATLWFLPPPQRLNHRIKNEECHEADSKHRCHDRIDQQEHDDAGEYAGTGAAPLPCCLQTTWASIASPQPPHAVAQDDDGQQTQRDGTENELVNPPEQCAHVQLNKPGRKLGCQWPIGVVDAVDNLAGLAIDGDGIIGEFPGLTHFCHRPGRAFFGWHGNFNDSAQLCLTRSGGNGINLAEISLRQVTLGGDLPCF